MFLWSNRAQWEFNSTVLQVTSLAKAGKWSLQWRLILHRRTALCHIQEHHGIWALCQFMVCTRTSLGQWKHWVIICWVPALINSAHLSGLCDGLRVPLVGQWAIQRNPSNKTSDERGQGASFTQKGLNSEFHFPVWRCRCEISPQK